MADAARPDPFGASLATLRREARERAVSILYEAEIKGVPATSVLDELPASPDELTIELVVGVTDHRAELDARIDSLLRDDWRPDRVAILDRIILRLAGFELDHRPQVPTAAIINEAVELAKRFGGTDRSYVFVNGLLGVWASSRPGRGVRPEGDPSR